MCILSSCKSWFRKKKNTPFYSPSRGNSPIFRNINVLERRRYNSSCSSFHPANPGLKKRRTPPFNSPLDGGKDAIAIVSMFYHATSQNVASLRNLIHSRIYVLLMNLCKSVKSVSFVFHFL